VYYAVDRFSKYGLLSGKSLADLVAGSRVDVDERKQNPLDFVLWKAAKPGEPSWPSPWGEGRPGWHIECSAMSTKYLGDQFDIHGGGRDLIFPHHENEIAQTEGTTGKSWVNYWLHNGFVNVLSNEGEREKMSKSLGNFKTIRDLLQQVPGEVIRMFILNSHYRSPLDFSVELLEGARSGLDRLYQALGQAKGVLGTLPNPETGERLTAIESAENHTLTAEVRRFLSAMDDDFNTSQALSALFESGKTINRLSMEAGKGADVVQSLQESVAVMRGMGAILGILPEEPEAWFQQAGSTGDAGSEAETVERLIAERNEARKSRDFARADAIRNDLLEQGIELLDGKEGTTWRRSR
ncbi:MAG: cysteine--tRNA ligase, partial [Magnetococcales bacterium]|nr:cysteine--tRNA ligase [Magnetococcales bacterium]